MITGIQKARRKAFLSMIAVSELRQELMDRTDDGYDVIVGATAEHPLKFRSYDRHPNVTNHTRYGWSTAAGRYQILHRYAVAYTKTLKLPDFGPDSQDRIALQMIKEQHALPCVDRGEIAEAIKRVSNIWASLPGAGYKQNEHKMSTLLEVYDKYFNKYTEGEK